MVTRNKELKYLKTLTDLKNTYPLLAFSRANYKWSVAQENTHYPADLAPKRMRIKGDFIRIENPMGGVDILDFSEKNIHMIHDLSYWRQRRANELGFIEAYHAGDTIL